MYKKLYNVLYIINIVLQGFWCLVFPLGIGFGIAWLLVEYADLPRWIFAVGMTFGVFVGLVSMCRFLISATEAMERLERSRRAEKEAKKRITHTPDGENEKSHMAEENEKSQENGEKDKGTDSDGEN